MHLRARGNAGGIASACHRFQVLGGGECSLQRSGWRRCAHFLADYAAVNLTEVLATFLTVIALVAFAAAALGNEKLSWRLLWNGSDESASARGKSSSLLRNSWFVGGLAVGCGTMVRPETPLILVALGLRASLALEAARRLAEIISRGRTGRRGLRASCDPVDRAQRNFITRISAAGAALRAKSG